MQVLRTHLMKVRRSTGRQGTENRADYEIEFYCSVGVVSDKYLYKL